MSGEEQDKQPTDKVTYKIVLAVTELMLLELPLEEVLAHMGKMLENEVKYIIGQAKLDQESKKIESRVKPV